jgi:hypothetical protein
VGRIQEIKARADAEMAQQQGMQQMPEQSPVAAPQPGLSEASRDKPMSRIQQIKMQADAAMAQNAEKQDKRFPYNAQQNREQGSPYPDYVFTRNPKEYRNLTPEQREVRKNYEQSRNDDRLRKLKLVGQEAVASPLQVADIGHGLYNLGNMATSAIGLTDPNPYREEEMPSHRIKQAMAEYTPIDLLKYQPQNASERVVKSGIGIGGSAFTGGGIGTLVKGLSKAGSTASMLGKAATKVQPYTTALLGAPETAGQAAALGGAGAAIGSGIQALAENDINASPYLLGTLAALQAAKGGKWAAGKIKGALPENQGSRIAASRLKGVIGEENIEKAIKNIQEGRSTPSMYGHRPTTAELANTEGLSMLEDAYRGSPSHKELSENLTSRGISNEAAKRNELARARGEGAEAGLATKERVLEHEAGEKVARQAKVDEALKDFSDVSSPEDTGKAIREGVESELDSRKKARGIESNDKYEYVRNLDERIPTGRAEAYLDIEIARFGRNSKMRRALQTVRNMFGKEEALNRYGLPQLDNRGRPKMVDQLADRLVSVREEIGDLRNAAIKAGNKKLALKYGETLKQLDLDFDVNPKISESWKTYVKESIPVNQIDQDPFFKSILKETDYTSGHVIPDSGIPNKLVNASEASQSVAHKFMNMFGKNKEVMKSVQGYVNQNVLDSILDVNGVPSEAKIASYLKKNKGSLTLYPGLETKLANARNAGKFFHQVGDEAVKESTKIYKDMFKAVTDSAPEKVVNNLLSGTNKTEKLTKLLDIMNKDTSGQALEGLRRAFVDHVSEEAASAIKFTNFYKAHKKELSRVMLEPQMKFLEELNKHYLDQRNIQAHVTGPRTGSQTAQRLRTQQEVERTLERTLPETILDEMLQSSGGAAAAYLKKGPGGASLVSAIKGASKWYTNAVSSSVQKNMQKAMLNPEFAEMTLLDMTKKGAKEKAKTLAGQWAKSYIKGYAIKPIATDKEEE